MATTDNDDDSGNSSSVNLKPWLILSVFLLSCTTGLAVFYFGFRLFDKGELLSQNQDPRQNPQLAPCSGVSELANLKISSTLLMDGAFLDKDALLTEQGEDAAREQLHFLPGALEAGPLSNLPRNVRFYLSAQSPDLQVGSVDPQHYRFSLRPVGTNAAVPDDEEGSYPYKAAKRGYTAEGDAGFEVSYEASVKAVVCWAGSKRRMKAVTVQLPTDPYLAYWQPASTSSKGLRRNPPQTKAKITITPAQSAQAFASFAEPFKSNNDPIRMTMIFGAEETPDHPPDVDDVAGFLSDTGDGAASANSTSGAAQNAEAGMEKATALERGAARFLDAADRWDKESRPDGTSLAFAELLAKLPTVVEADKTQLEKQSHHLVVDVTGWLKLSQRPIAIRVYFGLTDVHGTTPAEHWPFVLESLSKDDALTYSGPLGGGDDLSLAVMSDALGMPAEALAAAGTQTPHFLFASASGGSYSQLGNDVVELRGTKSGLITDTMLVASPDDRPQLNLALLRYIDRAVQGDAGEESAALAPYLSGTDMVVLEHHADANVAPASASTH